jgi:hypothetical protein
MGFFFRSLENLPGPECAGAGGRGAWLRWFDGAVGGVEMEGAGSFTGAELGAWAGAAAGAFPVGVAGGVAGASDESLFGAALPGPIFLDGGLGIWIKAPFREVLAD